MSSCLPAASASSTSRHRQRVGLLAAGAGGHPAADRRAGLAVGDQGRDDMLAQGLPRLGVAEKARDVDQQVVGQRRHLGGALPQQPGVLGQARDLASGPSAAGPGGAWSASCSRRSPGGCGCGGWPGSPGGRCRSRHREIGLGVGAAGVGMPGVAPAALRACRPGGGCSRRSRRRSGAAACSGTAPISGSWAMHSPPTALTACAPPPPLEPMPLITMPMARWHCSSARLRKKSSIGRLRPGCAERAGPGAAGRPGSSGHGRDG